MPDGSVKTLIIRRLRCCECGKIHNELPDILIPYKRHCAETIENAVNDKTDDICCEESTIRKIRRWWAGLVLYFHSVLASLEAKYDVKFLESIKPAEIARAIVNANLWTHTRSACSP